MKTKVKELRTASGITQQQLAELVHVSARTIISIEKEQYSPSLMLAYRMAEVFHVTENAISCYMKKAVTRQPLLIFILCLQLNDLKLKFFVLFF